MNADKFYRMQVRAGGIVQIAIQKGHLPRLSKVKIKCTDCDKKAYCYDHRDYKYPLLVSPVCGRCNKARGPAKDAPPPSNYRYRSCQ